MPSDTMTKPKRTTSLIAYEDKWIVVYDTKTTLVFRVQSTTEDGDFPIRLTVLEKDGKPSTLGENRVNVTRRWFHDRKAILIEREGSEYIRSFRPNAKDRKAWENERKRGVKVTRKSKPKPKKKRKGKRRDKSHEYPGQRVSQTGETFVHDVNTCPALLVYGTLRKDGGASSMLDDCTPFCKGRVRGYRMFHFGVPGIVPSPPGHEDEEIVGEVYLMRKGWMLSCLDSYEGAYDRVKVRVTVTEALGDNPLNEALVGHEIEAWVYVYRAHAGEDIGQRVPDGDWIEWGGSRKW